MGAEHPVCRDCGAFAEFEREDRPGAFLCAHGAVFARAQGFPVRRLTRADYGLPPCPRRLRGCRHEPNR